ncbi:unnamed protein product [Cylicocyclus nassatus]|uniref:Uncharacterized protein n=1 Tax=Cylicocyclus nassatus TaxID=53992 RepID=A0AA36DVG2_CYLNA|nr:unnamed protein product [Cylicocyclus nassatus]
MGDEDLDEEKEGFSQKLLIDRLVLKDLRNEAQKLLIWKKLTSIASEGLIKLITILKRNSAVLSARVKPACLFPSLQKRKEKRMTKTSRNSLTNG